ncbi:MAG: tetratricopeptide repeat protein [Bacteroidia bacterium]|nr:tetratricopeptide repeat protein [Bacteroidia bacterium]
MLTAKKKISVREAVPKSASANFFYDAQEWLKQNGKIVGGVVIGLVAIIVVWYFYSSGKAADDVEANRMLRQVMPLYGQQQYKLAITGDPNQNIPGLKTIVEKYGGTPTGQAATIYLANAYLYTDELDKAYETFDDASPDSDILNAAALAGKAAVYEAKKNYKDAAPLFEKAANAVENDLLRSGHQLSAGRAYGLSGDKEMAKKMLELVKEAKSTRYHQEADKLLAQFELIGE